MYGGVDNISDGLARGGSGDNGGETCGCSDGAEVIMVVVMV